MKRNTKQIKKTEKNSQICEYLRTICIFAVAMVVIFDKEYLEELYVDGKTTNKYYRFQPDIVSRYIKVVNIMKNAGNINDLKRLGGLHYEQLVGDKKGLSSVRVNNKYRVEFIEGTEGEQTITTICNITDLTNHYQ